jgi:hypothetical protein
MRARFYSLLVALMVVAGQIGLSGATPAAAVTDTCPCALFPSTAVPATASFPDANPIEVGVKFFADSPGYVDGVRFYKGSSNTGPHLGNLWTSSGQLLASATFTNETASGWQSVTFATPVPVLANTVYVASYHTTVGFYSVTSGYFTQQVNSGPLHALAGVNGVFNYGATQFPNMTFNDTNYWADVNYDPALTSTTLTSSPNPSAFAKPVTLTATVTPARAAPAPPSGTVTFFDGPTAIGSAPLNGQNPDTATLTTTGLSVADHQMTAVYAGSSAFVGSTSGVLTQHVQRAATTVTAAPPVLGLLALDVSAKLTRSDDGTPLPGQTVVFTAGTASLCTATTDATGKAECDGIVGVLVVTLNGGYTATFNGTTNYAPSSGFARAL